MEKCENIFQALARIGGKTFTRAYFNVDELLSAITDAETISKAEYRELLIKKPQSFYYDFNKSTFSYKGKEYFTFYKMKSFVQKCLKKEGGWENIQGPPLERIGGRIWKGTFFNVRKQFSELLESGYIDPDDENSLKLLKKDEITKIFYNNREGEFKITGGNKLSVNLMNTFLKEKLSNYWQSNMNYNHIPRTYTPCRSDSYGPGMDYEIGTFDSASILSEPLTL